MKNIKRNEYGRSMVEMLGVLAIVGVLSVMGIWGYTIAMIRYRANEVLAEATKRAMTVSALISAGGQGVWDEENGAYAFSLREFGEDPVLGVTFDEDAWYSFGEIEISLDGVSKEVCRTMKSMAEGGREAYFMVEGVCNDTDGGMSVIFNDDMSAGMRSIHCGSDADCSGCHKCEGGICTDTQSVCGENGTCSDGICVCSDGRAACAGTCCGAHQECGNQGSACVTLTGNCTTSAECGDNKYCYIVVACKQYNEKNECTNWQPSVGQCVIPLPALTQIGEVKGRKVYSAGDTTANWWNVRNICHAHGKQMATLSRLGLSKTGLDTFTSELGVELNGSYWLEEKKNSSEYQFIWSNFHQSGLYNVAGHTGNHFSKILCTD